MKVKLDFVTNSSSVCYLISLPNELTQEKLKSFGLKTKKCINDFMCTNEVERLIHYVGQEPCDWINKITGPTTYYYATKEWYEMAKKELSKEQWILFIEIERNYYDECVIEFENIINSLLMGNILGREYE
jgi:hypothetical protein